MTQDSTPVQPANPSTVGPDYPGVTGDSADGTRDMDRVAEEDEDAQAEADAEVDD